MAFKNLVSLAIDKEGSALNNMKLTPALQKAMATRQERAAEAAAEELINVFEVVESAKNTRRTRIRRLRKDIEREIRGLEKIDTCMAYAEDSGNFVPLLIQVGGAYDRHSLGLDADDWDELHKIPAGYKPKAPPKAKKATKAE